MAECPTLEDLRDYLSRARPLAPDQIERIEAHIEACDKCVAVLDRLLAELAPILSADSQSGPGRLDGSESGLLAEIPSGTTLPDLGPGYRVCKFLGSGAYGEVWLAQDLNLPRLVAIKTLRVGQDAARRARTLAALRHEAQLLTSIEHPNIVRVHSWLAVNEQHYLVLQYVSGGALDDRILREGPLDWQRGARYIADVGEGLAAVHSRGIIHRDIKAANILWDPDRDEALLTDFGVAARLGDPSSVGGSLPYMAPDAFDGRVSPALDVYSLAATLFHLVTGSAPFPGPQVSDLLRQIAAGLPDPDPRCTGLPEPLERIIRAGLAADPRRRPGLREFIGTLRGTLNQLMVDSLTISVSGSSRPAPVDLRLNVLREVTPGQYEPLATTHPQPGRLTRDMKRVPRPPEQVRLRTGDRVQIEVAADRAGYVAVFNVGPSGVLNLLHPLDLSIAPAAAVAAQQPLLIGEVELTPPTGRERLFAVWSRAPLPLSPQELRSLAEGGRAAGSRPYHATRDMKRVQQSMHQLQPDEWHAVVLELEHRPWTGSKRED
jgi:serine/threonine protein kinase